MENKNKGIVYILVSALFFALMAVFVKSIPEIPIAMKIFFRNFIGLVAVGITLSKQRVSLKPNNPKLMILRALFGLIGIGFYYLAIGKLALTDAVFLNKLSPVFVMVFAYFFLKESIDKTGKKTLVIALIGAVFVVRPQWDMSFIDGGIGILSAVFAGAAYTVIRRLTFYDKPSVIVFYFCLISSLVMLPVMLIQGVVMPSLWQWGALVGIGITALIAQLFMTHAYQYAKASEISIFAYADTIFSMALGIIIWRELPSMASLFGGFLIVLSGMISFYARKEKKTA